MSGRLFESLTGEAIQVSLAEDRLLNEQQRREDFEELRLYIEGGDDLADELTQHVAEKPGAYALRKANFASINFVGRLVETIANGIYGGTVQRTIVDKDGKSDTEQVERWQATYDSVIRYNQGQTFQNEVGRTLVGLGGAWVHGAYIQPAHNVCLHVVLNENIDFDCDPDNPRMLRSLLEIRTVDKPGNLGAKEGWAWVNPGYDDSSPAKKEHGWGLKIGDNGVILDDRFHPEGEMPDRPGVPYGRMPYTYARGIKSLNNLFEGVPYIRDAVTIQRALNNRVSDLDRVIKYQGFGVPVFIGSDIPETEYSECGYIQIDEGGDFKFAHPDAPIDQVIDSIEKLVEWMAQTRNVPVEIVKADGISESGVALAIKFRPYSMMIEAGRLDITEYERDLFAMVCAIGSAHGMDLPTKEDGASIQIEFMEPVVPQDESMERTQDQLDVESGNLSRIDYQLRWNPAISTRQEAEEYLDKLDEENEARAAKAKARAQARETEREGTAKSRQESLSGLSGLASAGVGGDGDE